MTRSDAERFADILNAIDRCQHYEQYLHSAEFGSMAYDAVLRNLGVIGEAVRALPPETRDAMPDIHGLRSRACATSWSTSTSSGSRSDPRHRRPPVRPRSAIGGFLQAAAVPGVDWLRKGVEMVPTMILFGVIFGRWWPMTLLVAALGWPMLLVATDVVGVNAGLIEAGVLAVANAGVGVLLHQGLLYAYRRIRHTATSGVPH